MYAKGQKKERERVIVRALEKDGKQGAAAAASADVKKGELYWKIEEKSARTKVTEDKTNRNPKASEREREKNTGDRSAEERRAHEREREKGA